MLNGKFYNLDNMSYGELIEFLVKVSALSLTERLSDIDKIETNWDTVNRGLYLIANLYDVVELRKATKEASIARIKALRANCRIFSSLFLMILKNKSRSIFESWHNSIQKEIKKMPAEDLRKATLHITAGYRDDALLFVTELFNLFEEALNQENSNLINIYSYIKSDFDKVKILRIPLKMYANVAWHEDRMSIYFQARSYLEGEKLKEKLVNVAMLSIKRMVRPEDLRLLLHSMLPLEFSNHSLYDL